MQSAGFAVMAEDESNQKNTSKRKTYTPVAYDSITFLTHKQNVHLRQGSLNLIWNLKKLDIYFGEQLSQSSS